MADSSEHINEPSGSIKYGGFLDSLRNKNFLRKTLRHVGIWFDHYKTNFSLHTKRFLLFSGGIRFEILEM
jgi:hypothetical protein